MTALQVAAPSLVAQLAASGYRGPVARVVTVADKKTECAVVQRVQALDAMRKVGGFDADDMARVEAPSPATALPVVLLGQVRGTARVLSLGRGGMA